MLEIIFFPMAVLISIPGAGFLPGAIFMAAYFARRKRMPGLSRKAVVAISSIWLIYGAYETYMYFWMQTVIAPIRVDLLIIVPVLYVLSIPGIILLIRREAEKQALSYRRDMRGGFPALDTPRTTGI